MLCKTTSHWLTLPNTVSKQGLGMSDGVSGIFQKLVTDDLKTLDRQKFDTGSTISLLFLEEHFTWHPR